MRRCWCPAERGRAGDASGLWLRCVKKVTLRRGLPVGASDGPVRVFLVDDHEVVRRGVAEVLEEDPVISVVGEAGSVAEALARVPAVRPDVTVVDMRLPDGDGAEVDRKSTRLNSSHANISYAVFCLKKKKNIT